jgi:hypothetical protein
MANSTQLELVQFLKTFTMTEYIISRVDVSGSINLAMSSKKFEVIVRSVWLSLSALLVLRLLSLLDSVNLRFVFIRL